MPLQGETMRKNTVRILMLLTFLITLACSTSLSASSPPDEDDIHTAVAGTIAADELLAAEVNTLVAQTLTSSMMLTSMHATAAAETAAFSQQEEVQEEPPSPTPTLTDTPSVLTVTPNTPEATITQTQTAVSLPTLTPSEESGIPEFKMVTHSPVSFACGSEEDSITITARVSNPDKVYYISCFFKLTAKGTTHTTDYQIANMEMVDAEGIWEITIRADQVNNPGGWEDVYFTYQLVMETEDGDLVRSGYYDKTEFEPCP